MPIVDNIIIQIFKKLLFSTVNGILKRIYDLPGTYTLLAKVAINQPIHIISLKNDLVTEPRMRNLYS